MAEKEDNKFDEQAFLLDFFEETVESNTDSNGPKGYPHFIQLTGDPTGVVNKISSLGAGGFLKLKTHQLALLVPQVRIKKVYYEDLSGKSKSEQEFRFDDYTTVESITESRGRGSAVGLMGFDWNDMGTNPGDSGLSFEATLKLKFQSFEALFKDRGGYKFADLVVPAGGKKRKSASLELGGKKISDDRFTQIKATVGWAEPNDPGRKIFSSDELRMIRNLKTTFILNLTTHDIDIKEDGSFDLTLSYMAAIEGRMMSPRADLLYVDASSGITEKIAELKKQIIQAKRLAAQTKVQATKLAKNPIKNRRQIQTQDLSTAIGDALFNFLEDDKVEDETRAAAEKYKEKAIEKKEKLTSLENDARTKSYRRLLEKIENNRRIFRFDLSQPQIELYNLMAEELAAIKNDPAAKLRKRATYKQDIINAKKNFAASRSQTNESHKTLTKLNNELAAKFEGSAEDKKKERDKILKKYEDKAKKNPEEETTVLNFFYFGDLINAALEILADKKPHPPLEDQFKFLLGTIDLPDSEGTLKSIPLSDIPISLNIFQNWFVKNVIKPMRNNFPFRVFIQKITSELITGVLSPDAFGPKGKSSKTRISTTTQVLSKNTFMAGRTVMTGGRYAISNLKKNLREQANIKDINNQNQFLFLYVGGILNQNLRGKRKPDEDNYGIFHFYVGADQGIVKRITFKRTDLPFQRESRIASAQNEAQSNLLFSDFYNADVTMIGNSIFRPGMMVFVDPRSMGLGSATSFDSNANLMGIGGYYLVTKVDSSIESGKFETNMSLISETSTRDIQKKNASKKLTAAEIAKDPTKGPCWGKSPGQGDCPPRS